MNDGDGEIILHLRNSPTDPADLRGSQLQFQKITSPGFYSFHFPALVESTHKDYYLYLEVTGVGSVDIGMSSRDNYLNGAIYENNLPADGQLTFDLLYESIPLFTGLFKEGLVWLGWLVISIFLFVIPGSVLMSLAWPNFTKLYWPEKLGISIGVSLAFYPLLMLFAFRFHIRIGALFAWLPAALGILILVWQNRESIPHLLSQFSKKRNCDRSTSSKAPVPWAGASLLALIVIIFFVRFWAIRRIDVPMWGDSVQHTVMTQLILDNNGLFTSWEPYAQYHSLSVQYGFSAHAALLAWLTGLPSHSATLITGQIINGLAILALIPLAYRLSLRNIWAAVATIIVAGLFSPMPAFYVNWGRYPQLAGQAILPVAIWLTCEFLENDNWTISHFFPTDGARAIISRNNSSIPLLYCLKVFWMPALMVGGAITGMILCSYRMIFFYVFFFAAWVIYLVSSQRIKNKLEWLVLIRKVLVIGAISLVLALPWLIRSTGSSLGNLARDNFSSIPSLVFILDELRGWSQIHFYLSYSVFILVVLACLYNIAHKREDILALVVWVGLLQLYFLGQLFRLPGATSIQVFAILIFSYIPASLISGWFIVEIAKKLWFHKSIFGRVMLVVCSIGFILYGINKTRLISKPDNFNLITRPDLRAMAWIVQETPADAKFLVSSYRYHTITSVGGDAGWWIPLFTRRQNTMPPQYALVFEVPDPPNLTNKLNNLVFALEKFSPASREGLQLLCKHKITHIYIGQKQIYIGAEARRLYSAEDLLSSPAFQLVYHQDRVYIFALKRDICQR